MKTILNNKKIFFPLFAIILIVFLAIFAPIIIPSSPTDINVANKFASPSFLHPLGTDHLGRDMLARLVYASRMSLISVMAITGLVLILSFSVGLFAGYRGGVVDAIFMRICDVFLTFPTFVLALFLIAILGVGLINVIVAIAITHWAWYARMVRSLVLEFKESGFVVASRAMGSSGFKIVLRHILPAVSVQMIILATLDLGHMLLHVAGLSFLGLGVQAPTAEWGIMINDAIPYIRDNPLLMVLPGVAIFITVASFNTLGEALRDKLDPNIVPNKDKGL